MPRIQTWVIIGLISLFTAVIIRIIAEKYHKDLIEVTGVVLIPVIGFLFSDSDSIDTRAIVIAYGLGVYLLCTVICHFVAWIIKRENQNKSGTVANSSQATLTVMLPVEAPFRIDQNFIDNFPGDVDSLTYMCDGISALTKDFTINFPKHSTDKEREQTIRSYFLGICYHILDFFDDSVRVHVRILTKHSEEIYTYEKFVATFNKDEYNKTMKSMSADNKMIQTSFQREQSLIASLNKTLCEPGSHRKWRNFLTFALHGVVYRGKPVFSVGVSTTRVKVDRLFFLNYCSIESIIERYVEKMLNTGGCKDFILNHYFPSS